MNKLKAAIQELRDHLGSDLRGIRLLEQLTEIANDQRKRCAALEVAAINSQAAAETARTKLDAAELKIVELRQALDTEVARRVSAEGRERSMLSKVAAMQETEPEEEVASVGSFRVRSVQKLVDGVRRRYKKMPGSAQDRGILVDDFVKSFTYDEYAGLGMVVSACAFMNFPFTVRAARTMRDEKGWKEEQTAKFVSWFRSRVYASPLEDRVYYESGAYRPDRVTPSP